MGIDQILFVVHCHLDFHLLDNVTMSKSRGRDAKALQKVGFHVQAGHQYLDHLCVVAPGRFWRARQPSPPAQLRWEAVQGLPDVGKASLEGVLR